MSGSFDRFQRYVAAETVGNDDIDDRGAKLVEGFCSIRCRLDGVSKSKDLCRETLPLLRVVIYDQYAAGGRKHHNGYFNRVPPLNVQFLRRHCEFCRRASLVAGKWPSEKADCPGTLARIHHDGSGGAAICPRLSPWQAGRRPACRISIHIVNGTAASRGLAAQGRPVGQQPGHRDHRPGEARHGDTHPWGNLRQNAGTAARTPPSRSPAVPAESPGSGRLAEFTGVDGSGKLPNSSS